jgi:hypothetical protein
MRSIAAAAVLVIFGAMASGASFLSASVTGYVRRSRTDFRTRERIETMLGDMEARLQDLAAYDMDYPGHPVLLNMTAAYAANNLTITDISSGIHLDFLPDSDLASPPLASFLFADGSAAAFIAWRNSAGLSRDTAEWELYLTAEALECCVSYGWIQVHHRDSFAFTEVSSTFGAASTDVRDDAGLFPLVNDRALINVNAADSRIFAPLLKRPDWRISTDKIEALENKIAAGPIEEGDLRAVLGLPADHMAYRYLGVKTQFWELCFNEAPYTVRAVAAALPRRGVAGVESYRIIEWRLDRA